MNDENRNSDETADLAAEFALGVLTGDDLRQARDLARSDARFRAEVARWSGRLAPLLEEVEPSMPPTSAWQVIESRIGGTPAGANVVQLRRRVGQWRAFATAMTALAACLGIFIVVRPSPPPSVLVQRPVESQPLLAMLGNDQRETQVVASWDPGARRLVLAVTGAMPSDPSHAHELWVIPPGGKPRSLGTMGASKQMHMQLADALAKLLQQGATIAISVEPAGGSPTGAPTGPVVASGSLKQA